MVAVMAREHLQLRRLLAVFCGGFMGTIARYLLSREIQGLLGSAWPYDILLINVTGAFMLAFLTMLAEATFLIGPTRRLLLNVGFLGAYTTFSSLALGDVTLFSKQEIFLALLYLICSLVGGIVAVLLGQISSLWLLQYVKSKRIWSAPRPYEIPVANLISQKASTQSLHEEEQTY
jgi:fluoride exporter